MVKTFILAALAAFSIQVTASRAATTSCPPEININEGLAGAPPNGWSVLNQDIPHAPEFVEFFETDPHNQGSLMPAKTELSGNVGYAVWNFDGDSSDLWIGCHYNHSTVMLYQRLAPNTKSCRVTYAPGGVVTTIDCK